MDEDGLVPTPGRNGATPVPGTNYSVRVDKPHVPGQQEHAHIYDEKGNSLGAYNKNGQGESHGTCPADLPKNKKLWFYLAGKGFSRLGAFADGLAAASLAQSVAGQACQNGDQNMCQVYTLMGGNTLSGF